MVQLDERSKQIRRDAYKLSKANGGYHHGGTFSCVEILLALFDYVLTDKDRFILSKGHGCWAFYVLLIEKGLNPLLEGHPHIDLHNGVNWTTGSLGHGLPASVGMAMARKMQCQEGRVIVLMGDGECQEGTTWESMLIAGRYQLDNLTAIVDVNSIQGSDFLGNVLPIYEPMLAVSQAAGWCVDEINGHVKEDILSCVKSPVVRGKPHLIMARTIKGAGIPFMENRPEWHANWPNPDYEKQLLEALQ